jgi:hypothetical protein
MREHFLFPRVSIIVARVSDILYLREHILMREHFAFSPPQRHYVLSNASISGRRRPGLPRPEGISAGDFYALFSA